MSCNWAKDGSFSEQDISRESSLLPGPLWIFFTNFHKEPFTIWQFLGKSEKFSKFLRTQTVWFARLKHSRIYEEAEESDHFQHQLQFHPKKWYNCVWKSTGFSNELLNSFETFQRQVDWKLTGSCPNVKHQIEHLKLKIQFPGVESRINRMSRLTKTQSRSGYRAMSWLSSVN